MQNIYYHQTFNDLQQFYKIALASLAWALLVTALYYFLPQQGEVKHASKIIYQKNEPKNVVVTYKAPEHLYFAGELVPLHVPDVRERFDREMHVNLYYHSNTILMLKRAQRWLPTMGQILKKNNIPEDFKYLPLIESSLANAVSYRGAVGFWQLMEGTAKEFDLKVNNEVDERYDPIKSTEVACEYLKRAYRKFGNWTNVAASYNMGMYGLQRRLDQQKVDSYYDLLLNSETARYVFRILAIKEIVENDSHYGYNFPDSHLYQAEQVKQVVVTSTQNDLVAFAISQGINYKLLKRHNPWLRTDRLTVRSGESYTIDIPIIKEEDKESYVHSGN
jgi:membrane-bound lytic murein transglycosylase D